MKTKGTGETITNDVGSALARGVDQAVATTRDSIDSLTAAAKPAVDRMTTSAHDVADQVSGAATQAAKSLGATGKKLRKMEEQMAKDARGYVREHPLASLGVALVAGYVVSRLLSSR